jgi:hypothetical protein
MRTNTVVCLLIATLSPLPAGATWSVVATDSETQEIVVASAAGSAKHTRA